MAEVKQSILSQQTFLPVSMVFTLIVAITGPVITFTTLSNEVQNLNEDVTEIKSKHNAMEEKYIPKKEVLLMFEAIKAQLSNIEGKVSD